MTEIAVRSLTFVPGREIALAHDEVSIKGGRPAPARGVQFAEVYAATPVLTLDECAVALDDIMPAGTRPGCFARLVAHARVRATGRPGSRDSPWNLDWVGLLNRPCRIVDCSDEKIAHSLGWIHTNLSRHAKNSGPDDPTAEDLFRAYALMLKADGYYAARHLTPNGSMALQRALVQAVKPHSVEQWRTSTRAANLDALRTLSAQAAYTDLSRACELSTFAGTTWFGRRRITAGDGEGGLGRAYRGEATWSVDDRACFIDESLRASSLVMILDDCGEAVFDLDLARRLLTRNSRLAVTILARRRPDGSNVTVADLVRLTTTPALSALSAFLENGRVRYVAVDQPFPSFEPRYFPGPVREQIASADVVLVKGAGFFETTLLDRATYHSFVVHGYSTRLLTGSLPGEGYFRRVSEPADAYVVRGSGGFADE